MQSPHNRRIGTLQNRPMGLVEVVDILLCRNDAEVPPVNSDISRGAGRKVLREDDCPDAPSKKLPVEADSFRRETQALLRKCKSTTTCSRIHGAKGRMRYM